MTMGPPSINGDTVYISAGANRHSAVADWSRDGTVAYGTDANIALWKPTVSCRACNLCSCPFSIRDQGP